VAFGAQVAFAAKLRTIWQTAGERRLEMRGLSRVGILVFTGLLIGAGPAAAKAPPAPSPLVSAIERCRQIKDPMQRLACYDSSASALVQATTTGQVSVVDRGELRQTRRSLFGFSMPKLPFFAGDTTADEAMNKLDSTITKVMPLNNGHFRMVIADGNAVWETTETNVSFWEPRPGQKITILRGPLGSYFLQINGQVGVRGHRVSS
jgi:hypothetical protein